jgi:hypothetical protein
MSRRANTQSRSLTPASESAPIQWQLLAGHQRILQAIRDHEPRFALDADGNIDDPIDDVFGEQPDVHGWPILDCVDYLLRRNLVRVSLASRGAQIHCSASGHQMLRQGSLSYKGDAFLEELKNSRSESHIRRTDKCTQIHIIQDIVSNAVRIGRTNHFDSWVKALVSGSSTPLRLLYMEECPSKFEHMIHRLLADHREPGGWFELTDDVQQFVADAMHGGYGDAIQRTLEDRYPTPSGAERRPMVSIRQVCQAHEITPAQVQTLIRFGMPYFQLGPHRGVRFDSEIVNRWLCLVDRPSSRRPDSSPAPQEMELG